MPYLTSEAVKYLTTSQAFHLRPVFPMYDGDYQMTEIAEALGKTLLARWLASAAAGIPPSLRIQRDITQLTSQLLAWSLRVSADLDVRLNDHKLNSLVLDAKAKVGMDHYVVAVYVSRTYRKIEREPYEVQHDSLPEAVEMFGRMVEGEGAAVLTLEVLDYGIGPNRHYDQHEVLSSDVIASHGKIDTSLTTSDYWDCNCKISFIKPANQDTCFVCLARREDQPDSHAAEVEKWRRRQKAQVNE